MRGCLIVLVLGALVLLGLVLVGLPRVASALVRQGVVAAGLSAPDLAVDVVAEPATDLLGLHADRIDITATHATWKDTTVQRMDLQLDDVDLAGRTAAHVEGTLDGVLARAGGQGDTPLAIDAIELAGPSGAIAADVTIATAAAETFIAARIREETGIQPSVVRLTAPDRLAIGVSALTVEGRLTVAPDGALRLETGVSILPPVTLVEAGSLPIRLTGVAVTERSLVLSGVLASSLVP